MHCKRVIASASEILRAVMILEVGVKFNGQASILTPESMTMSDAFDKVYFFDPVIDSIGILRIFKRGIISNNSFVSPEFE